MIDPLILFRAVHISATVLATGTVAFRVLVAEPAFQRANAGSASDFAALRSRWKLTIWIALAVAILSEAAWLTWLSADIYGVPVLSVCLHGGVWSVLTETRFGLVCTIRLSLALLLAALTPWPATRLLQLAAGAGLIALIGLIGHAGATPGTAGDIHLIADTLHLLAAAFWLGSLPALAMLLARARQIDDTARRDFAVRTTRRFSWLGAVCVAALLITVSVLAVTIIARAVSGEPRRS